MRTLLNVLRLAGNRKREFGVIVLLVSIGTVAGLLEPWIYSAIVDDVAGVFVASEPLELANRFAQDVVTSTAHFAQSVLRILSIRAPQTFDLEPRTLPEVVSTLIVGALLLVVARALSELASMVGDNRSGRLACDVERNFILRAYRHVLRLPLPFFGRRASGKIARQINQADEVSPVITATAQEIWPDLFSLVAIVSIVTFVNLELALVTLLALPAYGFVTWRMSKVLDTDLDEYYSKWEDVSAQIQESVSGVKTIRALGNTAYEEQRLDGLMRDAYGAWLRRSRLQNFYYVLQQMIVAISKSAVLLLGGYKALQHQLTPGTVVLFFSYLDHLFGPIENLTALYTSLRQHLGSVQRAELLLAEPVAPGEDRPVLQPTVGEVAFDDVTFGYGDRMVLRGVSFRIRAGERVALIGPSGAGKTTISDLLAGLYAPASGRILIDGQPLDAVSPTSVRHAVRSVAVDGTLFRRTLADNIRCARPDATAEDVQRAAHAAGLERLIARLPEGLETLVGERGATLSAGERQRVLLARVFIAKPVVLILDEATANLDFRTELSVKRALETAAAGRTTLLIAHRKSMLTNVDRVLVLEDGRIVQDGPPALLASQEGYYKDMMTPEASAA